MHTHAVVANHTGEAWTWCFLCTCSRAVQHTQNYYSGITECQSTISNHLLNTQTRQRCCAIGVCSFLFKRQSISTQQHTATPHTPAPSQVGKEDDTTSNTRTQDKDDDDKTGEGRRHVRASPCNTYTATTRYTTTRRRMPPSCDGRCCLIEGGKLYTECCLLLVLLLQGAPAATQHKQSGSDWVAVQPTREGTMLYNVQLTNNHDSRQRPHNCPCCCCCCNPCSAR